MPMLAKDPRDARIDNLAVIDIGSNSVRLVIYEIFKSTFTRVYNEKVLAGLGKDLKRTGRLNEEGKLVTLSSLRRYSVLLKAQGVENFKIVATAALRDASDAPEFIAHVLKETGFDISPLSGEQEAYTSAMGVLAGDIRSTGIAADLGGASLELVRLENGMPGHGISLTLGPFSMYEGRYDEHLLRPAIVEKLSEVDFLVGQELHLIGGAWRNLALIWQKRAAYPLRLADGYTLTIEEAAKLARWACTDGAQELLVWPRISKRRAETLPYAGLLLAELLKTLEPPQVKISAGGLREGVVKSAMLANGSNSNVLFDACQHLATGNEEGVNFGPALFRFLQTFNDTFDGAFERENETRLRQAACLLVGIGKGMHPNYKAALVFEKVLYAPMPNLTHKERCYLALILHGSYSSKLSTPNNEALIYHLSEEEQGKARAFGEAMRLGVVISGRNANVLDRINLETHAEGLSLILPKELQFLHSERSRGRFERLGRLCNLPVKI